MKASRINSEPVTMEEGQKLIYLDKEQNHRCSRYIGTIKIVLCLQLMIAMVVLGSMAIWSDANRIRWVEIGFEKSPDDGSNHPIEEDLPDDSLNVPTPSHSKISVTTPSSLDNPQTINSEVQTSDKVDSDNEKAESDGIEQLIDYEDISPPSLFPEMIEDDKSYDQDDTIQKIDDGTVSSPKSRGTDEDKLAEGVPPDEIIQDINEEVEEISRIWQSILLGVERAYYQEEKIQQSDDEGTSSLSSGERGEDGLVENSSFDDSIHEGGESMKAAGSATGNSEITDQIRWNLKDYLDDWTDRELNQDSQPATTNPLPYFPSIFMQQRCSDNGGVLKITNDIFFNYHFECVGRGDLPTQSYDKEIFEDGDKSSRIDDYSEYAEI